MAIRVLPRVKAYGSQFQTHDDRSYRPVANATLTPCGMNQNPRMKSMKEDPYVTPSVKATMSTGFASSALYVGGNYLVNSIAKVSMRRKGADPAAIKNLRSGGQIIKQGGLQFVSSVGSSMVYDPYIRQKISPDWYPVSDALVPSAMTGVLKTSMGLLVDKAPSLWNGITDFVISTGMDAGARAWMKPNITPYPTK